MKTNTLPKFIIDACVAQAASLRSSLDRLKDEVTYAEARLRDKQDAYTERLAIAQDQAKYLQETYGEALSDGDTWYTKLGIEP